MKYFIKHIILFITVLLSNFILAQEESINPKIIDESCTCIKKISFELDKDKKNEEIKSCITSSIISDQTHKLIQDMKPMVDSLVSYKNDTIVGNNKNYQILVDKDYDKIQQKLLAECPYLKELISVNNRKYQNSESNKKKANEYYNNGQQFYKNQQYDLALVEFNKAVAKDPSFAFAWDNLGLTYRKLNRYQQAIDCYKKSIELDPKGMVPIQNMAVAYEYLKDYKSAAQTYMILVEYYPEDAEGYYGAGRSYFANGDYENGLEYMFQAYLLYKQSNSPYIHDAETNIVSFYNDLKTKNELAIFDKVAKKYNIVMN